MGFFFYVINVFPAFPHTLFTAHASRTHVKAPPAVFPVKPDNSSGLTHDSPSGKPLRKRVTFQHQKAPKSSENTKP